MPIASDVKLGKDVVVRYPELVNLYGCEVGEGTQIGPFVEIQKGVRVGRFCKISSHSFLCQGVTIEDEVFIGHGVMFINDRHPRATKNGKLLRDQEWKVEPTRVGRGASVGSGAVILCGLTIGEGAMIGAGAVVTKDVKKGETVAGVPARALKTT